jgi:hypothetical protein
MKKIYHALLIVIFSVVLSGSLALAEDGIPLKYISNCQIDLNNDNNLDIVLLVETVIRWRNHRSYQKFARL